MSKASSIDLSVVVPCYNEQESLPIFAKELARVLLGMRGDKDLRFELVLVDDGSSDGTLSIMRSLAARSDLPFLVRWISFSRNFGKEAALYAGLEAADGDLVATMDADMQDPPSLLPQMYRIIQEGGCDSVATRRVTRAGEPAIRSAFARLFYRIINKISDADIVDGARDFRLMTRPMVDAVLSLGERNRFTKGIYGWVGFKTEWLPYENVERVAGETKWSFIKLAAYALDGIAAFSTAPLALASVVGMVLCVVALAFAVFVVVRAALFGDPVSGWPSLMTVVLLVSGVQLLCLGVIGQYLAKTYLETKQRPLYLVRERGESDKDDKSDKGNKSGAAPALEPTHAPRGGSR